MHPAGCAGELPESDTKGAVCARAGEEAEQFPAAEQREERGVGSEPAEVGRGRFMDRESRQPFWAKGHCFWEQQGPVHAEEHMPFLLY